MLGDFFRDVLRIILGSGKVAAVTFADIAIGRAREELDEEIAKLPPEYQPAMEEAVERILERLRARLSDLQSGER